MASELYTDEFLKHHPYPVFKISGAKIVIAANPAAVEASGKSPIGQKCYSIIFGHAESCKTCCLDDPCSPSYCVQSVPETQLSLSKPAGAGEDHLVTSVLFPDASDSPSAASTNADTTNGSKTGELSQTKGCFKSIHPVPPLVLAMREVRALADQITRAQKIADVLKIVREFLAGPADRPRYRVRQYELDRGQRPQGLNFIWCDTPVAPARQYRDDLSRLILRRDESDGAASFHALDHHCIVLVTPFSDDVEYFRQFFRVAGVPDEPHVFMADEPIHRGLRLLVMPRSEGALRLFKDGQPHCWLDVPLGLKERLVAKFSVTPLRTDARFTREEMEQMSLLRTLANMQIESLQLRERERARMTRDAAHEARQPAFMALSTIELMRELDRLERPVDQFDADDYYNKKNLETAIRMVFFLNDAAAASRDEPCLGSAKPVNLLSDVLAPVINLCRHNEFLLAQNRNDITGKDFNRTNLQDIELMGATSGAGASSDGGDLRQLRFEFGQCYSIHYSAYLGTVNLHVNIYRLQELMYNLLTNASKYRDLDKPCSIKIQLRRDAEFEPAERALYIPFYVIDIEDMGIGVRPDEAKEIFASGVRGREATLDPATSGTGRGLFIVREILLSIGGDVYVERLKNPTCFRLFIPAACRQPEWVEKLPETKRRIADIRDRLKDKMPPL